MLQSGGHEKMVNIFLKTDEATMLVSPITFLLLLMVILGFINCMEIEGLAQKSMEIEDFSVWK